MLKPEITGMELRDGVYWAKRGVEPAQDKQPQRLYLLGGTHGQEFAGPLAVQKLLQQDWRWPNVAMVAIIQDPEGYKEEGYGFVGVDEHSSMWPPLWGYRMNQEVYWLYVDENSAWGNTVAVPPRHKFMRHVMDMVDPTFVVSLHETVRSETRRDLFWCGAGLLFIETYPLDFAELQGAVDVIGSPLSDPIGWSFRTLKDWIRPMWKGLRWQDAQKALAGNPHYQLVTRTTERYMQNGGKVCGSAWMRYLEEMGEPTVGPGRMIHDPIMLQAEWKTATDYAVGKFACPAVTTESFQPAELGLRGVDERVDQQFRYVTAVLDTLEEIANENH